ncbi:MULTISPECIES: site-specific recombinase [unclassified Thioalkalivibrio]|uniref:site-specific recombinase n=1 Tax=unclassified Thioalkalivibrio TaxID=2621013 RepID=UPI0003769E6E|nr:MULTISPECIES: site-specific recombinase [unclassified Thioalkalivibrio]
MTKQDAEHLLARVEDADLDLAETLRELVDWLRPEDPLNVAPVIGRIEQLTLALADHPGLQERLRQRLEDGLEDARHLTLYTGIGLFSRKGFFREAAELIYERINPRPMDRQDLKDVLFHVFHQTDDAVWVAALPDDAWWRLLEALGCLSGEHPGVLHRAREEILYALEMLSIWVAAEELEPELLRLDPSIAERNSAFVAQEREISAYVRDYRAALEDPNRERMDDRHARVLLEQCGEQIARLRQLAITHGNSLSLTHLLERLDQTLRRIHKLLDLLEPDAERDTRAASVGVFRELITISARQHGVRALWQDNIKLVSRSITQHVSDTGEHYITQSRGEYFQMLRSGAGAGLIIAVMALIKIQIGALDLSQAAYTLWTSLNYGLGFVLIHILHFTVATKQPAMTAARLAAAIEESERGTADPRKMADLLMRVGRSQFAAVLGNVGIALPTAILIGLFSARLLDAPILSGQEADYLMDGLRPIMGLALFFAAIAGVWLFVSGLIAGFFDNRCAYLDLPGRLREHPWLRRLLPTGARHRLADWIGYNYGALIGNFLFGVLLGVTGYVGYLLSLPLDIQHVAFASANLGYVTASEAPGPGIFTLFLVFVLLIGAVNLWVSFGLALYVALRARGVRMGAFGRVFRAYGHHLRERPREFLFPPRAVAAADDNDNDKGDAR